MNQQVQIPGHQQEQGFARGIMSSLLGTAQETLYRGITTLLTIVTIVWLAVFLYATFYYYYMPAAQHSRPVHLQYKSCGLAKGLCTAPSANVTLTKRQQLLMVGQHYRVVVDLEMPESQANRALGMFMVCGSLMDRNGQRFTRSCRSTMLRYKSTLHHTISTLLNAFFLITGSIEEKQILSVELFSSYEENPAQPVTDVYIEVQSNYVEIYCATVIIQAHFTGLRHFMCHWPMLSAFFGITTNIFFLSVIVLLSWTKFFSPNKEITHQVSYDTSALIKRGSPITTSSSTNSKSKSSKRKLKKTRGQIFKGLSNPPSSSMSSMPINLNKKSSPKSTTKRKKEAPSKSTWDWEPEDTTSENNTKGSDSEPSKNTENNDQNDEKSDLENSIDLEEIEPEMMIHDEPTKESEPEQ